MHTLSADLCRPSLLCGSCWLVWGVSPSSRAGRLEERGDWMTHILQPFVPPLRVTGEPRPSRSRCCGNGISDGRRFHRRRIPLRTPQGPGNDSRPPWLYTALCCFRTCKTKDGERPHQGSFIKLLKLKKLACQNSEASLLVLALL